VNLSNNQQAFLELVRAGLWERDACLLPYGDIDFKSIYRLSQEQSVSGLVAAGLEHVVDIIIPQDVALTFAGEALQLEKRNVAMNDFISVLVDKMYQLDIYTLLVKGQGIAQCYERPLWRACGDVDFFLSESNYELAKTYLTPMASSVEVEGKREKHQGFTIDLWTVEIHGTLYCGLSRRMDKVLDDIQEEIFYGGNVRSWMNRGTQVFLPSVDSDVVYTFSHFLKHFYKEGLGLRQVCDWCRLLWTYKNSINKSLLETRLRRMGLMSEWKAFGSFAVNYLGMPSDAMPFYSSSNKWKRKASRICLFILEVGNMGHNRDSNYFSKRPYIVRKICSFRRRMGDLIRHSQIFPIDTLRFLPNIMFNGLRSAIRGE
jgi:hypothetical protein